MANDYAFEEIEERFRAKKERNYLFEMAIYIASGTPRAAARRQVAQLEAERDEAISRGDVIEHEEFLEFVESSLNLPSTEGLNLNKINAIYRELCEIESVSPR